MSPRRKQPFFRQDNQFMGVINIGDFISPRGCVLRYQVHVFVSYNTRIARNPESLEASMKMVCHPNQPFFIMDRKRDDLKTAVIWIGNDKLSAKRKRWICDFNLEYVNRGEFHTTHNYPQNFGLNQVQSLQSRKNTDYIKADSVRTLEEGPLHTSRVEALTLPSLRRRIILSESRLKTELLSPTELGAAVAGPEGACGTCGGGASAGAGGGLAVSSKVYPSPGAARGVWALPQPPPCSMAPEEPLPACAPMSPDQDGPPAAPPPIAYHLHHYADLHHLVFEAVRSGEVSEVERLVEKLGAEALSARDQHGYTLAHWAALDGSVAVMRYLIERGAPVDLSCLGTQGPRPIHWACRKGHASIVQVLLQAGVAVNAADFKGLTPLMTACMYGKTATAAYLLGMGAATRLADINGDTALHWAAYKGHAELVRLLIYSGVPLHCTDNFGSTPLHLACLSGNLTCVRLLCEKVKAELEPRDKNGKTPLMLAQSHRHGEVVKLLQKEMKRRAHWMPPLSELWGLLFGGAGDSKGPLLFFLVSVLLWGYPMYIIRCIPLTWNTLRLSHYCFLYWNAIMWLSWVIANRRDPGYIPQNSETYYRAIRQIPYYDKWKKRNVVLSRLCHTCRCLRPLRAKHCRICKRCVAYFDHHCPFIYNCVGLRNRMWFFLFVMSVAINCSFTIYFACYCLLVEGFGFLYVLGLVEAVTFCALGWILTCTSILHACMNLTTNEMFNYKRYPYLRDKRGRYQNPFSRGPLMNLLEFFICLPDRGEQAELLHDDI
ncbi:Probable protein S-acyltransferase 23 [Eumeta japonica]|uniref:Palmitoyltransferase n=1 Tax=Eumeta variegata TaxID=151549 RepID=A0A4C1VSS9_EUMVA|nr:Probable protein S-acyltransferase 23 [Eumeta japonica]